MKDKSKNKKAKVHKDLEGLNVEINALGEVSSNIEIDKINEFLNKTVKDKKLSNRKDESAAEDNE